MKPQYRHHHRLLSQQRRRPRIEWAAAIVAKRGITTLDQFVMHSGMPHARAKGILSISIREGLVTRISNKLYVRVANDNKVPPG